MNLTTDLKQKEKLLKQIETLETDNVFLKQQIETLEENAKQKQTSQNNLIVQLNESKAQSFEPISEKTDLKNNLIFLTSEKEKLSKKFKTLKTNLDNNLNTIDTMLKDLGFIKGEIATLIEQVSILEGELPVKIRYADNLEEKISRSCANDIITLYNDMKAIEKKVKLSYYKSYKERDEIASSKDE